MTTYAVSLKHVPPSLKQIGKYLDLANSFEEENDTICSAYCLTHAARLGWRIRDSSDSKAADFLDDLMDQAETQRRQLTPEYKEEICKAHIAEKALELFKIADDEDLRGMADMQTANTFRRAMRLFEVLEFFGPLDEETKKKHKYSGHKAVEIAKAIRQGRKPRIGGTNENPEAFERAREEYWAKVNSQKSQSPYGDNPASSEYDYSAGDSLGATGSNTQHQSADPSAPVNPYASMSSVYGSAHSDAKGSESPKAPHGGSKNPYDMSGSSAPNYGSSGWPSAHPYKQSNYEPKDPADVYSYYQAGPDSPPVYQAQPSNYRSPYSSEPREASSKETSPSAPKPYDYGAQSGGYNFHGQQGHTNDQHFNASAPPPRSDSPKLQAGTEDRKEGASGPTHGVMNRFVHDQEAAKLSAMQRHNRSLDEGRETMEPPKR